MGITTDISQDFYAALAALDWQLDCGVDEAIGDAPIDRFSAEAAPAIPNIAQYLAPAPVAADGPAPEVGVRKVAPPPEPEKPVAPAVQAQEVVAQAHDIAGLERALQGFALCQLRKGARNSVFRDGVLGAPVMVVADPPSREEDLEGMPFVGAPGILLERMFGAIGLSRAADEADKGLYLTAAMPWRPLTQTPDPDDVAMMRPFLLRHIALAAPHVVVVTGPIGLEMLTGLRSMTRARGQWLRGDHIGQPDLHIMPMAAPADLLRGASKAEAWADLLQLQAKLRDLKSGGSNG